MDLVNDHVGKQKMNEIDVDVPCSKMALGMLSAASMFLAGLTILGTTFVLS